MLEDTVGDEDDGIMSEDAAEEKEGPQALNTTSRQLRYYYCRKNLKGCHNTEHTEQKHFSLLSSLLHLPPEKHIRNEGLWFKQVHQPNSLMPEFKGTIMERDVCRKISSNHALRIKRKYKKI